MATHDLKTWPDPFQSVWEYRKTAEFRKDDREPRFAVHDYLHLKEWNPDTRRYTGRMVSACVTHVTRDSRFGIPEGYAMLSLGAVTRYPKDQDAI